jgi:hypothetical protein
MHWQVRNPLPKPLVGSSLIEIQDIGLEEAVELPLMEDQEMIQACSPHASQKTFADSICLGSSGRCSKHFDATSCKSQDSVGGIGTILRAVLKPYVRVFSLLIHSDSCAHFSRRVLGFTHPLFC